MHASIPAIPTQEQARRSRHSRGTSIIEFTLVLPLLLIMILALIEFGNLIQARLIVANVAREGGSISSRSLTVDQVLADLVARSGHPLLLNGGNGKVIITRIDGGLSDAKPAPTVTTQVTSGGLAQASSLGGGKQNLGLPANLYNHLVFRGNRTLPNVDGPDITQLTMVEIFYKYRPITPLPKFVPGLIPETGLTLQSHAIF